MAVRIEANPLTQRPEYVIDGFEQGISDSPEFGIADMRNINDSAIPGVALVNYKLKSITQASLTVAFTTNSGTNLLTLTTGTFTQQTAFYATSLSGSTGLTAGTINPDTHIYYVIPQSGTTAKVYSAFDQLNGINTQVTLGTGGGTFHTVNMGVPTYAVLDVYANNQYILDNNGRVFVIINYVSNPTSPPILLTGNTLTNAHGNGLALYNNYLIVFRDHFIDTYGNLRNTSWAWINGWKAMNAVAGDTNADGTPISHQAKAAENNVVYYCDLNFIGSITQTNITLTLTGAPVIGATNATLTAGWGFTDGTYWTTFSSGEVRLVSYINGSTAITWTNALTLNCLTINIIVQVFDPAFATGYSFSTQSLILPFNEKASCLEEPSIDTGSGRLLYIGTSTSNLIYPWDEVATPFTVVGTNANIFITQYTAPIPIPEIGTYKMLNINRIVYILAGQQGNIYYTNGSMVEPFKTVPKQPSGTPYPFWVWGGIMVLSNRLCFGVTDGPSNSSSPGNAAGCWSINVTVGQLLNTVAGAIRYHGQPSSGLYNTTLLIPFPDGLSYYAGWYNGTYGGVDVLNDAKVNNTPTFYSNYESYLETDIVPIGTAITPANISEIAAKLDTPLVAGEKFRISMRSDLSSSYTQVFEQTTTGAIDGTSASTGTPLQNLKWVQIKAELQAVNNGSFVRLREIRIRIK